ncbi:MAG: HAMP domain-containing histidine kinase [Cyclobacteriaceae bacterium]|nr:HAMP domain-containing histidine kinase [Cyclobacteriaceae bacterium]
MANEDIIKKLEERVLELEQEKDQLLKLISHDVKSPFNKLYALSNLLQLVSENLNEEQLDYLNRMEWVIKEGLTVVRNLMDLRAIENNNIELSMQEVQIELILQENFKSYSKQIQAKNISLDLKIDKVTEWSDKRSLDRILNNLISNAVKFTPKKSKIIAVLSSSKNLIELQVITDSGPIGQEETQLLFQRNSPLSTRPTYGESALGNGLFIAQQYAQAIGGKISFTQEGSKVCFKLELPKNSN